MSCWKFCLSDMVGWFLKQFCPPAYFTYIQGWCHLSRESYKSGEYTDWISIHWIIESVPSTGYKYLCLNGVLPDHLQEGYKFVISSWTWRLDKQHYLALKHIIHLDSRPRVLATRKHFYPNIFLEAALCKHWKIPFVLVSWISVNHLF